MMNLFDSDENPNLLPYDGEVHYFGKILDNQKAHHYFEALMNTIEWKNDEAVIFGRLIVTKRKVAWYGDIPFEYTYSNKTKIALPWTKELLELKTLVQAQTGESFNSCLLNLYHNGNEGMAWHSDGEKDLKKNGTIASLSFGATRKFLFKHKKTKETTSVVLESGSLITMGGKTQTDWLHRLPLSKHVKTPRINLTFRTIDSDIIPASSI